MTKASISAKSLATLATVILALLYGSQLATADQKTAIARAVQADPNYLILNMPPRPDAWPGAIFTSNLRIPLVYGKADDTALHRGSSVSISSSDGFDLSAEANAGISSWVGLSGNAAGLANITLTFPDAQIVDMAFDDLVDHIKRSPSALEAAKKGTIPVIVIKSYYGTPVVTLTKKDSASASAWANLQKDISIGAKASGSTGNTLQYTFPEKSVFAFETAQINLDPADLNRGVATVTLASLPENLYMAREESNILDFAEVIKKQTGVGIDIVTAKEIIDSYGATRPAMQRMEIKIAPQ